MSMQLSAEAGVRRKWRMSTNHDFIGSEQRRVMVKLLGIPLKVSA